MTKLEKLFALSALIYNLEVELDIETILTPEERDLVDKAIEREFGINKEDITEEDAKRIVSEMVDFAVRLLTEITNEENGGNA